MLFYSVFKRLIGKTGVWCMYARALHADGHAWVHEPACSPYTMLQTVIIELKNDLALRGTLHSVDQYLNIKLLNVSVDDVENYPHMVRAAAHPRLLPARRPTARTAAPPRRPARSPSRRSNR